MIRTNWKSDEESRCRCVAYFAGHKSRKGINAKMPKSLKCSRKAALAQESFLSGHLSRIEFEEEKMTFC